MKVLTMTISKEFVNQSSSRHLSSAKASPLPSAPVASRQADFKKALNLRRFNGMKIELSIKIGHAKRIRSL